MDEEGWDLKTYEFTKLWRKNGLRLRNEHGYKPPSSETKKRKRSSVSGQEDQTADTPEDQPQSEPISAPMSTEEAAARAQRLMELQIESDQRMQSRKRRRRIRGYGHLPPDEAGTAPRYASETSLDECKSYLHLDNETYVNIRKEYTAICEEMKILKKTECPDGVWEESKIRLISENPHLSAVMHPLQPDLDKKNIALECLAADVTKRMRVTGRAITIADANNILDLNPTESKAVRRSFYEILAADKFESRLVSGEDHWNELRQKWFDTNEKLKAVVLENDPQKMRAVDLLGRDTMKRFREDRNARGERVVVQQNAQYGPGPGPAWAAKAPRTKRKPTLTPAALKRAPGSEAAPTAEMVSAPIDAQFSTDPNLQSVVENGGYPPQSSESILDSFVQAAGALNYNLNTSQDVENSHIDPNLMTVDTSVTAQFCLAKESPFADQIQEVTVQLTEASMAAVHAAVLSGLAEHGLVDGMAQISAVRGLVTIGRKSAPYDLPSNDELGDYLSHVAQSGTTPRFEITLESKYAQA